MQQGWNSQIWCMKEGSKSIYCMIWLTWNSPISKTNLEWLDEFRIVVMDGASIYWGLPCSSGGKESACNSGDPSVISGSGRSLEKGWLSTPVFLGFPCVRCKESACNEGDLGSIPGVGKIPWSRAWQSSPVFLPGETPRTEESGGLQSTGSQGVGHDWATKHSIYWEEMWGSILSPSICWPLWYFYGQHTFVKLYSIVHLCSMYSTACMFSSM